MSKTLIRLNRGALFSPAPPAKLTVLMHRYGQVTDVVYSSKDLVGLQKGIYGRIEVQLPLWIGQADGEEPRVGTEPHPQSHMDAIVKVAGMLRPYLAEKGTLWLWLVESSLAMCTHAIPPVGVLARARHANRPRTAYNRNLSPNFDTLGVLGELAFARQFGGRITLDSKVGERSDPGFDFATRAGTVNVKCTPGESSEYLLLQASRKHHADIQVLAFANAALTDATLVGWEYTAEIVGKETFDPGYGEPAWACHYKKLRAIETLKIAAEITWVPDEPLGIIHGVLDQMLCNQWLLWGTDFIVPKPPEIAMPRVYVFSPR